MLNFQLWICTNVYLSSFVLNLTFQSIFQGRLASKCICFLCISFYSFLYFPYFFSLSSGEFPTCKADMYSYGICLWQLLTREKPYGNENMYVVIFGVVSYNLRPKITRRQENENKSYMSLVRSLWKLNPEDRPTAQQVMVRLRSLRKRQKSSEPHLETKARWRF